MSDLVNRQAVKDWLLRWEGYIDKDSIARMQCRVIDIPSAQPEQRWVFCNTSEPETSGDYLLYRPHFWGANKGQITVCYWNCHEWSDNYRGDAERHLPVIDGMAWMPLPEPYKESKDETD